MKKYLLFTIAVFALAFTSFAQPGTIDLTFNPPAIGFGNGDGANNTVYTTSIQSDGKIIIGGSFTSYNGIAKNYIARMNSEATIDDTFNTGAGADSTIRTITIQNDGKIIIGGEFTSYNGTSRNCIARLNSDGTLDSTFNPGTGANNIILTTSLQSDGKIIIGGWFTSYNGSVRNYIARLNADGSLDTTFNPTTGANNYVLTTSIQSDGKLIIGGSFTSYNGTSRSKIARITADGTLDTTFNPGSGANSSSTISTVSIQQGDGKIIIGGNFTSYNGTTRKCIARLNINGTIDSNFNPGMGVNSNSTISSASIQSDGKIIIGGDFTSYNGTGRDRIARLNINGTLDTSFSNGGSQSVAGAFNNYVTITLIQSDGKIIVGGDFSAYNGTLRPRIARINTNGTLDLSFNPATEANGNIRTTSVQTDGKIIIGGDFESYNGTPRKYIARINTNGTLDPSFNPGSGPFNGSIYNTSIQNDGKIIIGGSFTSYDGISANSIARLNADGTRDVTFNSGTGANSYVSTISIQSDGKIIIGGTFTTYNGTARNGIARLNIDGSLDGTFNPGTGTDNVLSIKTLSNGQLIIGGNIIGYNGNSSVKSIVRLNANGTLDSTFNAGSALNSAVQTIFIQSDGKIIIGGNFTTYNTTARKYIARLNADGTLDNTFMASAAVAFDNIVYTTSLQSDGKIIIGGDFTSYNGIARNKIARLNTDGTLDVSFNPGSGANNNVRSSSIQTNGQIIIGGMFTSYNGTTKNRITRINSGAMLADLVFDKNNFVIYPNPSKGVFNISTNDITGTKWIVVYSVLGQKILSKVLNVNESTIDISSQPKGVYLYKVSGDNGEVKSGKLVVE
ncbi:T9SS type A sorting domain-containing protein [Flavobacterium sp.]